MSLNMSVTRITLDIRNIENQLSFAVKQNDTARRIVISLTDGGKPYTIERGSYAVFSGETSGHKYISEGCQIAGNEIIYDFTTATAATVGCIECDVTLFGSTGEVIASPCFTMNVYESKMSEYADEVLASDDFSTLRMLITDTVAATESAVEATESAVEAVKNIEQTLENGRQEGLVPFIGENGNWWIGTTDTGVSASGGTAIFDGTELYDNSNGEITTSNIIYVMVYEELSWKVGDLYIDTKFNAIFKCLSCEYRGYYGYSWELIVGFASGTSSYVDCSGILSFDWMGAVKGALGVTDLVYDSTKVYSGELFLIFSDHAVYLPGSMEYLSRARLDFTVKYAGMGRHTLTLITTYNGKIVTCSVDSEMQDDGSYQFVFSSPQMYFTEVT